MNLPFTPAEFFTVLRKYNIAVWPLPTIFILLAMVVVFMLVRNNSRASKLSSGLLAFLWMWMGIAYHLVFFTAINKAAWLFGIFFIIQGLLFLFAGVFARRLVFHFSVDVYGITGILLVLFALFGYPAVGLYYGRIFPFSPTFGLPCPTTIFSLGLFLMTKKCPVYVLLIPLAWSGIGFSASFLLGVKEDVSLLVAALLTLILLSIRSWKNRRGPTLGKQVKHDYV
jgi:hypothetical protein